jgi:pimeloyl-ACP methyl ester carboxylesterase
MVPGLAGGMDLLGPLANLLSSHYRVIAYQLCGEDDCFAMRRQFDLSDLVGDLDEIIDWFGLEQTSLLGVSFGGLVALEYAARFPSRLSRLAVQGVGSRFESSLLEQIAGAVLKRYPLPPDNPFVNQFFNLLFGKRQAPGPLFEFVTQQCWQTDQSVMAHRFALAQTFDMGTRLGRIRIPTLALAGNRDLLVSQRSLRELADGLLQSQVIRFKNEGHLAFVTCPDAIAKEVHSFLAPTNLN